MHAKVQIKDIGPRRFVQAPKMGEIFYRDSVGACVPETYQKCTKNGPKTYPMDVTVTPENIFEIKNQNFAMVLILIPSGDSHNDKLTTNGKERLIPPSQR